MTVGKKIYELRNKLGLTQKEFANTVGVSQSAINYWENGKRQPRIEQLRMIASAFNMNLSDFLDDDYFDAVTDPDNDADYEEKFIEEKFQSIIVNDKLNDEEKKALLQDHTIKTEIMANIHLDHAESGRKFLLSTLYNQLNPIGRNKAIEQIELLTKIPEYTMKLDDYLKISEE